MYKVIKHFYDLKDKGFLYMEGDPFPREGKEVSEKRLIELSTSANAQHEPLIAKVEEKKTEPPKEEAKPKKGAKK